MITKVVFRKTKKGGHVIAVFPQISWNYTLYMAYTPETGHYGVIPEWVRRNTKPVKKEECQNFIQHLMNIGYYNLCVMPRVYAYNRLSFCKYGNKELPYAISAWPERPFFPSWMQ